MSTSTTARRRLQGVVVSTAMKDTAVVRVDRRVADSKYGKYFNISKKFKVHDPEHTAKVGDMVEIEECRPLSRDKYFRLVEMIRSAASAA